MNMINLKEVCTPEERKRELEELLHFKKNPRNIRIVVYSITNPFYDSSNPRTIYKFKKILERLMSQPNLTMVLITRKCELNKIKTKEIIEFLYGGGVKIYYNNKIHAKTIIVSRKYTEKGETIKEEVAYVTSANLTTAGYNTKHEIGLSVLKRSGEFKNIKDYIQHIISLPGTEFEKGDFDG